MLRLSRDVFSLVTFMHLGALAVAMSATLSGCSVEAPEGAECRRHALYRDCTITEGEYLTFSIGMSIDSAFDAACSLIEDGTLSSQPIVFSETGGVNYDASPFCEKTSIEVSADYWSFIELGGFREKRVRCEFS